MKKLQCKSIKKNSKQIIVDKKELQNLLSVEMWKEYNLLMCIVLGRKHPDYKTCLYLACIKFEIISSFVYIDGKKRIQKLNETEYKELLFDSFLESAKETKYLLAEDLKISVNTEPAGQIYEIYSVCAELCCHMMACRAEMAYAHEFAFYIDFILSTEGNIRPEYEGKFAFLPKNMPNCYDNSVSGFCEEFEKYNFRS